MSRLQILPDLTIIAPSDIIHQSLSAYTILNGIKPYTFPMLNMWFYNQPLDLLNLR